MIKNGEIRFQQLLELFMARDFHVKVFIRRFHMALTTSCDHGNINTSA
jgi:citrate synthase